MATCTTATCICEALIGDAFKAHMDFGLRKTGKSTKYHKCHYCEGTCTSGDMGAAAGVKHLRDCPKVPAEVRGAAKQALEETEEGEGQRRGNKGTH